MSAAVADLAPSSLHLRDRISVYGLGCDFVRTLSDVPADHVQLQSASARAVRDSGGERRSTTRKPCRQEVHLWDALSFVTHDLATRPGQRVILVVSSGRDEGSRVKWNELRVYAQNSGVTLFGMNYMAEFARGANAGFPLVEDLFVQLCELTGGTVLPAAAYNLHDRLSWFVTMLRERYILDFPRPWNATAGQHAMAVSVGKTDYFVRAAGTGVPLADPHIVTDPATIPSDPLSTPTLGSRRPLAAPQ